MENQVRCIHLPKNLPSPQASGLCSNLTFKTKILPKIIIAQYVTLKTANLSFESFLKLIYPFQTFHRWYYISKLKEKNQ